jgi:CheY-like chemotaxis protein
MRNAGSNHSRQSATRKSVVLIVDDDSNFRHLLGHLLKTEGFDVAHAGNGEEALTYLLNAAHSPACILLDLVMPIMDGWRFREIQQFHHYLGDIPVFVLSDGLVDRRKVDLAQVCGVFSKTTDLERLVEMLKVLQK